MPSVAPSRLIAIAALVSLSSACGPSIAADDDAPDDDAFLAEVEESVDALCVQIDACEEYWGDQTGAEYSFAPLPGGGCYRLVEATERISAGPGCAQPDTMLDLYACFADVECPQFRERNEVCAAELRAIEDAMCNPF
jgi:hypothetical protein